MDSETPVVSEQPAVSPEVPVIKPKNSVLAWIVAGAIILGLGIGIGLMLNNKSSLPPKIPATPAPISVVTPTPNPTANWKTYVNRTLGFTFKYPAEYNPPEERKNYLSLISPLNSGRGKGYELQNGELKIEIVTEAAKRNDSPSICWGDHTLGEAKIVDQSEIAIDGINTTIFNWEGNGTGQFICVVYANERYLINKYPIETTRQPEFNQILSTFKFLDQTTDISNWKTYPDAKTVGLPYSFKYPPTVETSEVQDVLLLKKGDSTLSERFGFSGKVDSLDSLINNFKPFGTNGPIQFSNKQPVTFGNLTGYKTTTSDGQGVYYFLKDNDSKGILIFNHYANDSGAESLFLQIVPTVIFK